MQLFMYIFLSSFIVSLIALIGVVLFPVKIEKLKKSLIYFIGFSTGALFGGAFFHLLPEVVQEEGFTFFVSALLIGGIIIFFTLEKVIHWHHDIASYEKEHANPIAFMSLIGGAFHNLLDGLIIGVSYLINIQTGIAITGAIVLHKIPTSIGWFGVLVHSGFSKLKAVSYSYLSSLFTIVGALLVFVLGNYIGNIHFFVVPIAAGGFIYLAGSDLIPELHKEPGLKKSILQLLAILAGLFVMALLLLI